MSLKRPNEWRAATLAAILGLGSLLPLGWLQSLPGDATEVAAVFAPWSAGDAAFFRALEAGGLVVRQGATASILIVHGEDRELVTRLYAAGAWAVVNPRAFGGCLLGPPRQPATTS